jgi:hypothetical protein
MSDELRGLFDRFAAESLARIAPPGPAAVKRTVRRRYATRAVAFAVLALAALALVWTPPGRSQPQPIGPTPSPSVPSSVSPEPSSTGSGTGPAGSTAASPPADPDCDPNSRSYIGLKLGSTSPEVYSITPEMLSRCPGITIWLVQATYVGAGASAATLTRTASTSATLSADRRSADLTQQLPPPSCASVLVVTFRGYLGPPAVPASLPNLVPNLVASGNTGDLASYLQGRGLAFLTASWQAPSC